MHANTLKRRANRERILSAAARNIAEHGFAHITRPRLMEDSGLAHNSLRDHFSRNDLVLAVICERHANALLEATGCVEPDDPTPPRASSPASTPTPTPTPS